MSDWETTIIPLDHANTVLAAFGIDADNREYQRWRREDGFRQVDFEEILAQSDLVLTVDWRAWLQEVVEEIVGQLEKLGFAATAELDEEGNAGTFTIGAATLPIKYTPNDGPDFCEVIAAVNRLLGQSARYLKFRSCEGTDGWQFAVLKRSDWQELIESAGSTIRLLFTER
jgi:hypothetical protein